MKRYGVLIPLLLSCAALLTLVSCVGDGSTLDPLGNPLGPPQIAITPENLSLEVDSGQVAQLNLEIKNTGGFPLQVQRIESQADWIQIGEVKLPLKLEASDSVLVPVTVGKPDLSVSTHSSAIRVVSNDEDLPTVEVPITLKVTKEVLLFEPTFTNIQNFIFTPICTECHAGAGAPRGLQLSAGSSYDLLVNVRSDEKPELFRVEPFNPDNSYLIMKLEGAPGISGGRMPLNRPPLGKDQIKVIRRWISSGAPNN